MNRIIIDAKNDVYKTAVIDDDNLVEFIIDDMENKSLVKNVYVGVVENILPNQFAFINIGREKKGFLFLKDKKQETLYDESGKLKIKQGDSLLVQAVKDETDDKGAFLTTEISLAGKYTVLIKSDNKQSPISISKKIKDKAVRKKFKEQLKKIVPKGYTLIIRTNSIDANYDDMENEVKILLSTYKELSDKWNYVKGPKLVYSEGDRIKTNLRDLFNEKVDEVIINDENEYLKMSEYIEKNKLTLYNDEMPIFKYYNIEKHIRKLNSKKVWLKSGGFLYIEPTEACVVIDVNTGKSRGKKNHEKSVLKVNIEAGVEIAKQVRLRNLSGIIIVDFINMEKSKSYEMLLDSFKKELAKDRISSAVAGVTNLGLVEMTRKKTSLPLHKLYDEYISNEN